MDLAAKAQAAAQDWDILKGAVEELERNADLDPETRTMTNIEILRQEENAETKAREIANRRRMLQAVAERALREGWAPEKDPAEISPLIPMTQEAPEARVLREFLDRTAERVARSPRAGPDLGIDPAERRKKRARGSFFPSWLTGLARRLGWWG